MLDYKEWKHVFKLDPNKAISDEELELVCESGTDGIIVGGSDQDLISLKLLQSHVRKHLQFLKVYFQAV